MLTLPPPGVVVSCAASRICPESRMRMIDGGITVPSVPAHTTIPLANLRSYPPAIMLGNVRTPMVSTVAPTTPVVGASSTPMTMLATPRLPARPRSTAAIVSSRSAESVVRCRITPR